MRPLLIGRLARWRRCLGGWRWVEAEPFLISTGFGSSFRNISAVEVPLTSSDGRQSHPIPVTCQSHTHPLLPLHPPPPPQGHLPALTAQEPIRVLEIATLAPEAPRAQTSQLPASNHPAPNSNFFFFRPSPRHLTASIFNSHFFFSFSNRHFRIEIINRIHSFFQKSFYVCMIQLLSRRLD